MKLNKLLTSLAVVVSALGMSSCSEDFDVAAPYKDVSVVYGMMNVNDTAHYVRIQKVFMDQNRSALDLAKLSDSSYFRSLDVQVKGINANGNIVSTDVLNKVDLANENMPKDAGAFFQSPSYAYKFTRALDPANTYRIVIKNLETGNVDSAETNVINTSRNFSTAGSFYITFFEISDPISFSNQLGKNLYSLSFSAPYNAKYAEGYIRFKYTSSTDGGPQVDSSFVWNFANVVVPAPDQRQVVLEVSRNAFFSVLRDNIKPAPSNVRRYIDSLDMYIWVANDTYYTYLQAAAAQSGITADQLHTSYTNIRGKDALGIFASRAMRMRSNIPVDLKTLDSLKINALTKSLNISGYANH